MDPMIMTKDKYAAFLSGVFVFCFIARILRVLCRSPPNRFVSQNRTIFGGAYVQEK
jgi:hypothetical protein